MALVSGLGVSETGRDDMMRLSLLVDWLSGMLGGPLDQERASQARLHMSAHVSRAPAYKLAG